VEIIGKLFEISGDDWAITGNNGN